MNLFNFYNFFRSNDASNGLNSPLKKVRFFGLGSILLSFCFSTSVEAQTVWYVNDDKNTGDIFATGLGATGGTSNVVTTTGSSTLVINPGSDVSKFVIGQGISGVGIPVGATIVSVSGNTVVISANCIATAASVTITIASGVGSQSDPFGSINQAITAANASFGADIIYVDAGLYYAGKQGNPGAGAIENGGNVITGAVTIIGAGMGITRFTNEPTTAVAVPGARNFFSITASNVIVKNLTIDSYNLVTDAATGQAVTVGSSAAPGLSGIEFKSVSFINCPGDGAAGSTGGAMAIVYGADVNIDDCVFANNGIIGSPSSTTPGLLNPANNGGGLVINGGTGALDPTSTQPTNVNITNTLFVCNHRSSLQGGAIDIGGALTNVVITNCSFYKNRSRHGGAIYHAATEGDVRITGSTFSDNWSTSPSNGHGGGAIKMAGGSTMYIFNSTFERNTTISPSTAKSPISTTTTYQADGGAILVENGEMLVEKCSFTDNYAYKGMKNASSPTSEFQNGSGSDIAIGALSDVSVVNCTFNTKYSLNDGLPSNTADYYTDSPDDTNLAITNLTGKLHLSKSGSAMSSPEGTAVSNPELYQMPTGTSAYTSNADYSAKLFIARQSNQGISGTGWTDSGTSSKYVSNDEGVNLPIGANTVSPAFNIPSTGATLIYNICGSNTTTSRSVVEISTNGGTTWTNLETYDPTNGTTNAWQIDHALAIPAIYNGLSDVKLRFSSATASVAIDDIRIAINSDCGALTGTEIRTAQNAGNTGWTDFNIGAQNISAQPAISLLNAPIQELAKRTDKTGATATGWTDANLGSSTTQLQLLNSTSVVSDLISAPNASVWTVFGGGSNNAIGWTGAGVTGTSVPYFENNAAANTSSTTNPATSHITSPSFTVTGLNPHVAFDHYTNSLATSSTNTSLSPPCNQGIQGYDLVVSVSTNGGASFTPVGSVANNTGTSIRYAVSLSAYVGQTIQVRFSSPYGFYENANCHGGPAVDNVNVQTILASGGGDATSLVSSVITPAMDLSNPAYQQLFLKYIGGTLGTPTGPDLTKAFLHIDKSLDGGVTWSALTTNPAFKFTSSAQTPPDTDISSLIGQTNVKFRFTAPYASNSKGVFLDDIQVLGHNTSMISPAYTIPQAATLYFDVAASAAASNTNGTDLAKVYVSTDNGTTYSLIYTADPSNATALSTRTVDLSAYAGMSGVKFKFVGNGDGTNGVLLDNIYISSCNTPVSTPVTSPLSQPATCLPPTTESPAGLLSILGNVYNDTNGRTTIDGTLIDPATLVSNQVTYAVLSDASGKIVGVADVTADGSYSFTKVATPNTTYGLRLVTTAASNTSLTIGSLSSTLDPSALIPVGWYLVGEQQAANPVDATADGIISVSVATSDVTNVKFGLTNAYSISGIVYNDVNGLQPKLYKVDASGNTIAEQATTCRVDGAGTSALGMYAVLIDRSAPTVISKIVAVPTDGAYSFEGVSVGTYDVMIVNAATGSALTVGDAVPTAATLPTSNWVFTGEGARASQTETSRIVTSGSATVTVADVTKFPVGSYVYGIGIPSGATVTAVDAGTGVITLSAAATSSGTVTLTSYPGSTGDGTTNGKIANIVVGTSNVVGVDFGLQEKPTATAYTAGSLMADVAITNGGTIAEILAQTADSDVSGGNSLQGTQGDVVKLKITGWPTGNIAKLIVDNAVYLNYTSFTDVYAGGIFPANLEVKVVPTLSAGTVDITYIAIDNNLSESASTTYSIPFAISLPIELVSFTAVNKGCKTNVLTWTTATEKNNSHFLVQRSVNGTSFENVGKVTGSGTTSQAHTYSFNDSYASGSAYYRLRQVDFDGQSVNSNVVFVKGCKGSGVDASIYPNPTNEELNIVLNVDNASEVSVNVYNTIGQLIISRANNSLRVGANTIKLSTMELAKGNYFLKVESAGQPIYTEIFTKN